MGSGRELFLQRYFQEIVCLFWAISEVLKTADAPGIKTVPEEHCRDHHLPFGTGLRSFRGHLTTSQQYLLSILDTIAWKNKWLQTHFPQRRCLEFDSKKGRSRAYDVCIKWKFIIREEVLDSSMKYFQHQVHRPPPVKNSYGCSTTEISNLNKAL